MLNPSISWPFGDRYSVERGGITTVIVTTRPWWPWSEPKQWRLVRKSDAWFWGCNGKPLTLAPRPVWLALEGALEDT